MDVVFLASESAPFADPPPKLERTGDPRDSFVLSEAGKRVGMCRRVNSATRQNSLKVDKEIPHHMTIT